MSFTWTPDLKDLDEANAGRPYYTAPGGLSPLTFEQMTQLLRMLNGRARIPLQVCYAPEGLAKHRWALYRKAPNDSKWVIVYRESSFQNLLASSKFFYYYDDSRETV